MATARTTLRHHIYDRIPGSGFAATADSVTVDGIIDLSVFAHSRMGGDSWADAWLYRPNLTGDDEARLAGEVDTDSGLIEHTLGVGYSNTLDLEYEIVGRDKEGRSCPITPEEINKALQRSLRYVRFLTHLPLTRSDVDFDMESDGLSFWAASANSTIDKVSSAAKTFSGGQSLEILLTGSGGYAWSQPIRVIPGTQFWTAMIGKADIGTLTFNLYDETNGAVFGTAPSYSGEEFARLWRVDTIPDGCEEIRIQPTGTSSGDTLHIDSVIGPYRHGQRRFLLPTYMDEMWKLVSLRPAMYRTAIPGAQNVDDAWSRYFSGDYELVEDFAVESFYQDSNPNHLILYKDLPDTDMWMQVERPFSDVDDLDAEASTTNAPLEWLLDIACAEVMAIAAGRSDDPTWDQMQAKYTERAAYHQLARPATPRRNERSYRNIRA